MNENTAKVCCNRAIMMLLFYLHHYIGLNLAFCIQMVRKNNLFLQTLQETVLHLDRNFITYGLFCSTNAMNFLL